VIGIFLIRGSAFSVVCTCFGYDRLIDVKLCIGNKLESFNLGLLLSLMLN